ncbi:MAG TPA: imidazole glycerol phosphate synthase subunit HisH [Chitinophagaceae bacterium]|jgi:glutamine amidotransferase|nr:imidazole glycerol phosphate synthase subunit HisH [Chitinophagaceae bacterium]HNM33989.1 imidazole glycerol phosphate synthase subunit HisH [Chitinophagaceae bacterium]
MLTIIDYGIGNLSSIKNMLRHIGVSAQISSDIEMVAQAEKLILPGVGHFNYGMEQLHKSGLVSVLNKRVLEDKVPILGICLGAQLLTKSSEEGSAPGLGWIDGKTIAFNKDKLTSIQKIPHMGWSNVSNYQQSKLFTNIPTEPRFYFVHSYHLQLNNKKDELVTANYGYQFAAGIEHENILGVQFHPEKSHKFGMKLLENFAKLY